MQIEQHEAATGKACPALVRIPGATKSVGAIDLVTVTGERGLSALHASPAPTDCLDTGACEGAQGAGAAEATAADTFVAIVEGAAPEWLSAEQVIALAEAVQHYTANAVLEALPKYIQPLFGAKGGLTLDEV